MSKQTNSTGFEIAVIGMAGRFPGAANIGEYWENLVTGKETISFFTHEELLEAGLEKTVLENPNYVKANGFLEGSEYFDSSFFGYTEVEARLLDPQTRIFHECAWAGLEDAGYCPAYYNGLIGLYVGASTNFHWEGQAYLSDDIGTLGAFSARLLMDKDFLGGWVSYKLDLKGPCFTMATACSTSLVAIHEACQAVLNGECDIALAGGVAVTLLNKTGYMYTEGFAFSPDGHVRAFDAGPHGIIGGNGAAVVVLKQLEDALQDRDHIYAVIKGSSINNDGINKAGFTAPSIGGQARVIKAALEMAEVEPESIGYVETHGTATELGDPVEIQALKLAFNTDKRQYCRIGSVKTNIGHLDAAAGAAGLIKAALCIKHKLIPPSLHFKRPNPQIDFENSPFYVNARLSEWRDDANPLRAGVSSFGIGGTNAHVILEEAPLRQPSSASRDYQLLLFSAKTIAALDRMVENAGEYLTRNPENPANPFLNLADAAYTLQTGRQAFQYRRMLVCSNREEAARALSAPQKEDLQTRKVTDGKRSLVFMFSGQGSQYVNMGLDLYNREPLFREEADRCFSILESFAGLAFKDVLYPSPDSPQGYREAKKKITDVRYSGPITLLLEYSMAKLLMKWGLEPDAMIGYSFGEYTAACLAGVFSLEDVLKLAVMRGEMIQRMPAGSMMSVPLPGKELQQLLPEDISIAAVNGPEFCTVSGPPEAIKKLRKELKAKGHDCYRFLLFRAGHSRMMVPFKEEFITHFEGIRMDTPKIPYISGLTGTWITRQQAVSPHYWARHMSETIHLCDGIGQLIREVDPIFVQVGSDRGLTLYVDMHPLKKEENLAINMVRYEKEKHPDVAFLLNAVGELWKSGVNIDWNGFYAHEKRHRISLPTYSFERISYPPDVDINKIVADWKAGKSPGASSLTPRAMHEAAKEDEEKETPPPCREKRKRAGLKLSSEYAPPGNEMEQKLVEIFQLFFGIEPVGIHDDFYELGGDSLKAVQLASLVSKTGSGIAVSIKQLLFCQNIHDICRELRKEGENGKTGESKNELPPAGPASKDRVSEEELRLMENELNRNNRLSGLLKKNTIAREYEVSPIQSAYLVPPYGGAKMNFAYYYTDFSLPVDLAEIHNRIAAVIQGNSLLRSVIIERKGNHFIREYDSFANIRVPFLDLSSYSPHCREKIIGRMTSWLNQPMDVLAHTLYRMMILKMDHAHWRLMLQLNHLISDGTCVVMLDKQFHAPGQEIGKSQKTGASNLDYHDYVHFMKEQNYDPIGLDKYVNLRDYSRANKAVLKNYNITDPEYEPFEVDISIIGERFRNYYNEIAFFTLAGLIGDLFGVDMVPIEYVSNGRIYKDGNFNHIIGDFHDNIPVLFSLDAEPLSEIERFIDYKCFVRENNLNFTNYVVKGNAVGYTIEELRSPFSFNSLIGSYDFFKNPLHEKRIKNLKFASPRFSMMLLEDFSASKLWISFLHNSGFNVKEAFMKNYSHLIEYLDKEK